MNTPKQEMQQLIETCFHNADYETIRMSLSIYETTFGRDSFFESYTINMLSITGPKVSIICLDVSDDELQSYLETETYQNLEIVHFVGNDYINDLSNFLPSCESKYICFYEKNQCYSSSRIASMVYYLESLSGLDAVVCVRNHINQEGLIMAHPDYAYEETLGNKTLQGKLLLEYSINANVNLYGILSTLALSCSYAKSVLLSNTEVSPDLCSMALLYQLLLPAHIYYSYNPLVSTYLEAYHPSDTQIHYATYIRFLINTQKLNCTLPEFPAKGSPVLKKQTFARKITFINNLSGGGLYNVQPLIEEAKRRGFEVTVTDNRYAKAEIGIYSQHICFPENSKFSVILLHDLMQGSLSWPNFWEVERWNNFDLGILPGKTWADRFISCNCFYYANPRYGVYTLGYPKSDITTTQSLCEHAQNLRNQLGLKHDFTVLYAPSWENDGKEDDFINALSSLNINLLIKQNCWKSHEDIRKNIDDMRQLHENKFENVHYISQEESIFTAISLCDVLVSDESNAMADAILLNKPSIAVIDWLIPDKTPSRPAFVPVDYVIKCSKAELQQTVQKIMTHTIPYEDYVNRGWDNFSNMGNCCKEIMDAIEYYTQDISPDTNPDFLSKQITNSQYTLCSMWN